MQSDTDTIAIDLQATYQDELANMDDALDTLERMARNAAEHPSGKMGFANKALRLAILALQRERTEVQDMLRLIDKTAAAA